MKISLFAGVHGTDQDQLTKALLRNADMLRAQDRVVPPPQAYRDMLTATLDKLGPARPAPEARDILLDAILPELETDPAHLILCCDTVLGPPRDMFATGRLYAQAETRLRACAALFEGDDLSLHFALRNPASLLPELAARSPYPNLGGFLQGVRPETLRWSDFLTRVRLALPECPVTVWCTEDTPFVWGEVIRAVAGLAPGTRIAGAFDVLASIMEPEGMRRFRAYLGQHPTVSDAQRYRIMAAFLDKYALDEALEAGIDQPGWDSAYVDHLSALYDADLTAIAAIPGVALIAP